MKRRDLAVLICVAAISAVISLILASVLFSSKKLSQKVPVVQKLNQTFPDVAHDPAYTGIFNDKAIDLTQPVQIGPNNQNQKPFNPSP